MRAGIQSFAALAGLALKDMLRQPLTLLLTASMVAGMGLLPVVTTHTLGEGELMIADSVLALHFFLGLLLAGTAACQAVSGEMRRGTAATILCKPVGRVTFILAKFTGIAAGMALFSAVALPAAMIAARAASIPHIPDLRAAATLLAAIPVAFIAAALSNYLARRPFVSDAFILLAAAVWLAFAAVGVQPRGDEAPAAFGAFYLWSLIPVQALIAMALLLLAAIALAAATRLTLAPTVAVCGVVFLVGLMADHLVGRHASAHPAAAAAYALLPNWQHFWLADALHLGTAIPAAYLSGAAAYAALYAAGILALAVALFRFAEVDS
jgi:ABC-type transport system involved in multi-copper enzyme maturation permease subunit